MKRPTIQYLWPVLYAVIVLGACQKEANQTNQTSVKNNAQHSSGAVPDDPAKLVKIPLIVSGDFFNKRIVSMDVAATATTKGGKPKPGSDATPPKVTITSPANGSSVSGSVTVAVTATDNIAVTLTSLSVDGNVIGTLSSSPYSFTWDAASVVDGTHTLLAKATDAAGNSGTYSIVVSKNGTIINLPPSNLPSSSFLTTPPVGDQGAEGSCAVFATTYAARSIDQYYTTNASAYSYATNIFSPEFVYDQTKVLDCGSGTGITTALDFMISKGVCTWQTMPYSYSNGCSLAPTSAQLSEALNYRISSYAKIVNSDVTSIKSMIVNKHAVIITINPDASFDAAGPGFIWRSYSGAAGLSHNIVICGYDDAKHAYKIMNSWGTGWGEGGFAWIDYDFLPQASYYYCYVINV